MHCNQKKEKDKTLSYLKSYQICQKKKEWICDWKNILKRFSQKIAGLDL
jgi:hypothetical protein